MKTQKIWINSRLGDARNAKVSVLDRGFMQNGTEIYWTACGTQLAQDTPMQSGTRYYNFNVPNQNLAADLVAEGVGGTMGYVTEPYTRPVIYTLFPRYYQGYNLGDSYSSSSHFINHVGVYVGDPKGRLNQ